MVTHFTCFFLLFQGDDEPSYDWSWRIVVDVVYVYGQSKKYAQHTREAISLNELKMFKIAMWNHRTTLINVYGIGGGWEKESCHDFCFQNKFLQLLELEQAWPWFKVS